MQSTERWLNERSTFGNINHDLSTSVSQHMISKMEQVNAGEIKRIRAAEELISAAEMTVTNAVNDKSLGVNEVNELL